MAIANDALMARRLNNLLSEIEYARTVNTELLNRFDTYRTELVSVKGELSKYKSNSPKIGPKDLETLLFFMTGLGEGNARINVIKWIKEMFPDLMLVEAKNFTESLMDKYSVYQDRAS